jgi:uncharacterized membrane protein YgcG
MRRILTLAILAALTVGSPALAAVEDTAGVLTTAQAQDLDHRLGQLLPPGSHRILGLGLQAKQGRLGP